MSDDNEPNKKRFSLSVTMPVGIAIGAALFAATSNPVWIAVGVALGAAGGYGGSDNDGSDNDGSDNDDES